MSQTNNVRRLKLEMVNPFTQPQKMNPVKYEIFFDGKLRYWFVTRTLNREASIQVLMGMVDIEAAALFRKIGWAIYITENKIRYQFDTNVAKNKVKPFIVWHLNQEIATRRRYGCTGSAGMQ